MFVRARIDEGVDPQAILVPQQGVTRTPRGDASVMLVNDKNQVETREVVATQAVGDKWLITSGLKPGDKVIVSGLQKVRPASLSKRKRSVRRRPCNKDTQPCLSFLFIDRSSPGCWLSL